MLRYTGALTLERDLDLDRDFPDFEDLLIPPGSPLPRADLGLLDLDLDLAPEFLLA